MKRWILCFVSATLLVGSGALGTNGLPSCTAQPSAALQADIKFTPRTLNLRSDGNYVQCIIGLPSGYSPQDIDAASVMLNGSVPALPGTPDGGGKRRIFKFDRGDVIDLFCRDYRDAGTGEINGDVAMTDRRVAFPIHVSGQLRGGEVFAGDDTCSVIHVGECGDIPTPSCEAPDTLDFGEQSARNSVAMQFYIRNTGAELLNGVVEFAVPCSVFTINLGGGPYSLAPEEWPTSPR